MLAVVATVNPWREDRLPDRFPTIVQDSLIIALFALVAILFMQEKILATTAVGAVVIGFALQDTLGNLFSGLAIQIEKPFRVGQWVTIGGTDGIVMEVTWRATKMRTKAGNFVIVPNSVIAKETITNYSEPTRLTRIEVLIGASYDTPPNEVKTVIVDALRGEPLLAPEQDAEVLIADFAASSIAYLVRVWTADFAADSRVRDAVRSRVYYAFRRHQITIPYPIQVEYRGETPPPRTHESIADALRGVELFAALSDDQRTQLARGARPALFAAGEIVVREGDRDASLFVVMRGEAVVSLAGTDGEVARQAMVALVASALGCADERCHHEHAECEQHGLKDVRALIAETEQDRERPAAGKGRAEHLGADQDRGRDHGDDAGPGDLAGGLRGLQAH